jgi:two-component system, NarL family, response regulator DesR
MTSPIISTRHAPFGRGVPLFAGLPSRTRPAVREASSPLVTGVEGSRPGRRSRAPGCDDDDVPIRLAIVDDHPAIAAAIVAAVGDGAADAERIDVVGVAHTAAAGIALVTRGGADRPEVVLTDIQLETGTDGFVVLDAARANGCRAIVLTGFDRSSFMRAAFDRGADGFLSKASHVEEIIDAIRRVAAGGTAFSAAGLAAARSAPRTPSEREIAVLERVAAGDSSEEIGVRLGISARTVESHLRRLFDRYGVISRTELAVLAVREGWVEAG